VLGCTHYPFLRASIAQIAGPRVRLIDTGAAVARQVARKLPEATTRSGAAPLSERFWTSGDVAAARRTIAQLWGTPVELACMPAP
jgi:glutamate racemase